MTEEIKAKIRNLIADFRDNYKFHKENSEANVETRLVEPLFKALGWDVKDWTKQTRTYRGEKRGRADYIFRIENRPVFILEVKRVDIALEKEANKQVISYALSQRIPIAVSTNFECMNIFCVEQIDAIDKKFRAFEEPEEYLSNIQDLLYLSKESFQKNIIFDKAASEDRLRKRISIDIPLLEDFMNVRKLISNDIEKSYPNKYESTEKDEIVQRIIDRLIFIRRSEDIGINPENMHLEGINHQPDNKAYPKLKEIFTKYNSVYNSGLFKPSEDNDCDNIKIDGTIIKKLLSHLYTSQDKKYIYDFSWIDADILGQVYEQYLGIILAQTKSGKATLKDSQAHRKEQGIYYTPTYIVEYIVNNSIREFLKNKRNNLKTIKILDPACGSGSFLIKAFDCLYRELSNNDESKQHKLDYQGDYSIKTEILKNNIYGVDLDNKAVEITKLNLLLKAAENLRKLPEEVDLHIQHGNSLIDDKAVAGSDAFAWADEFKEQSFDIIIGNPPYIRIQALDNVQIDYFNKNYISATKNYDIYALFVEKALSLLKEGGILGYILPSKFFHTDYGEGLRKCISNNNSLFKIVDFKDFQVFNGATTYTCLLFLKKNKNKSFDYMELSNKEKFNHTKDFADDIFKKSTQSQPASENIWNFVSNDFKPIMKKLLDVRPTIGNITESIYQGIITGADKIFIVVKAGDSGFYSEETKKEYKFEKSILHPLLKGSKHIRKYRIDTSEKYVIFPYRIISGKALPIPEKEFEEKYPNIYAYLLENKNSLQKRDSGKMKGDNWYLFSRNQNLTKFDQVKIMTPCIAKSPSFTYDEKKDFFFVGSGGGGGGAYGITLKDTSLYYYVLALFNSKITHFFIKQTSSEFSGGYYAFNKQYIENVPIIITKDKNILRRISDLAKRQLEINSKLTLFGDKNTSETAKLKNEIEKTGAEIDDMIYTIFGITMNERKIIEEYLK